jgi:hypothetical protein
MNGSMNDQQHVFGGYRDDIFGFIAFSGRSLKLFRSRPCPVQWFVNARKIVQDSYNEVVEDFTFVPLEVRSRKHMPA